MSHREPDIEVVDDDMAAVLRRMTGWERLKIVDMLYDAAWQLFEWNIRADHPEWDESQIQRAVAEQIAGMTD